MNASAALPYIRHVNLTVGDIQKSLGHQGRLIHFIHLTPSCPLQSLAIR